MKNLTDKYNSDKVVPIRPPQIPGIPKSYSKQDIIDSLEKPFYEFDFAEWAELSKSDPELFETRRQEVIGQFLGQCQERNSSRIQGLQWRIEQERKLSPSPMASCLHIYTMMWDHLTGDNGMLSHLRTL